MIHQNVAVISLARRQDRRARFARWNEGCGLPWHFVDAVDGRELSREQLTLERWICDRDLPWTMGSIGCALSHVGQWLLCAAGVDPVLIVEDDALVSRDLRSLAALINDGLESHDIVLCGYNWDAGLSISMEPGCRAIAHVRFEGEFRDDVSGAVGYTSAVLPCLMAWGTLGYAVSPRGASRLLDLCLPLSSEHPVASAFSTAPIPVYGLDGMLNSLAQRGLLDVGVCFPPLITGPNEKHDSDVQDDGER